MSSPAGSRLTAVYDNPEAVGIRSVTIESIAPQIRVERLIGTSLVMIADGLKRDMTIREKHIKPTAEPDARCDNVGRLTARSVTTLFFGLTAVILSAAGTTIADCGGSFGLGLVKVTL